MKIRTFVGTIAISFALLSMMHNAYASDYVSYNELSLFQQQQYNKIVEESQKQEAISQYFFKNVYQPETSYQAPEGENNQSYAETHKEIW